MLPSFEERSVWVQLVGLGLVLGGYFASVGPMLARGVTHMAPYIAVFAMCPTTSTTISKTRHTAKTAI